jgi:hypothetical protein
MLLSVKFPMRTAATTVILVTLLSGCSPEVSNDDLPAGVEQTLQARSSAVDEYREAQEVYELPEGQSWPEPRFTDEGGSYESGYGESEAVLVWNCAWGREYLVRRADGPVVAAHALEQFAALTETDAYQSFFDPVSVHPVIEGAIENARLGDPTGIQSIVTGGCPP